MGESALASADSVSWQVFRNPVSLLIGGIAAVLLELAEPRVRSGVWDHTTFRTDPLKRMRRTGLAAMVTVFGARSVAEPMIAGVRRMHERVVGITPAGIPYRASDPELLRWVHATAAFGFLQAYQRYVRAVPWVDRDRYYSEGVPIARLYGAENPPSSEEELQQLLETMMPRLESSEIVREFLQLMRDVPLFPRPLGVLNGIMVRAAVEILPPQVRDILGLGPRDGLPPGAAPLVRLAGSSADRISIDSSPAAQACIRLGLPPDEIFRR